MISYLYYEEPPIPMSVGVIQMNYKNIQGCGFYTKDGTVNPDNAKNDRSLIGCPTTDLDKESAYKCGLKCWGSNTEYYYTFKGVKFAIYGTIDTGHYDFDVKLNGVTIDVAHENGQKKGPVIVYESDVLSYGEYEVGVVGKGQAYEFYKLVYWPSLTARRINSTEFIKIEGFVKESDNIGGIQEYMPSGGYGFMD